MSLSAKDFNQAADILRAERGSILQRIGDTTIARADRISSMALQIDRIEDRLIAWFQAENPRFDPARFRRASQP